MARDLSFNWNGIVNKISYNNYKNITFIFAKDINWSPIDEFRACQTLDLTQYFKFIDKSFNLAFIFNIFDNHGVAVFIEDKNKHTYRPLKVNKKPIPLLAIDDLSKPMIVRTINSISQDISSELDKGKNCRNYPFQTFKSYGDCDKKMLAKWFKKYSGIRPFWAVEDYREVTKLR